MLNNKKLITVAASAVFALGLAGCGKEQKGDLRIGVEGAYPPFSQVNADGSITGFDIDIAFALCEEMGYTCELVPQDWDGIIPALQANKFDAIIASMTITEERKEKVSFSEKYYNTPSNFIVKIGSGIEISKDGLAGKVIGVQRATIQDGYVQEHFSDVARIATYGTSDESYLELQNGRVDTLLADRAVIEEFIASNPGFEIIGDNVEIGTGAGVAVRKDETDLADEFTDAIDAIRSNGKYKEINDKYFTYDIYGN